jgi:hypothetical protein
MNLIKTLYFFSLFWAMSDARFRSCHSCNHYIPGMLGGRYDTGKYMGQCQKFFEIHNTTDEIEFTYALKARTNESMCGKIGKFYEPSAYDTILMNIFE